jgi:hypothetical protein
MSWLVLLDAGPLGLVTNPKGSEESRLCKAWLAGLVAFGVCVAVPEGADYEVRREWTHEAGDHMPYESRNSRPSRVRSWIRRLPAFKMVAARSRLRSILPAFLLLLRKPCPHHALREGRG